IRQNRHRRRQRSDPALEASFGNGRCRLARRDRQQSERHGEHHPRLCPKMVAQKKGRILVLSSMQGKHGTKDAASYSASKWGILGLMKSAALELGQYGITVNAIIPGLVDTALTRYETRLRESMAENGQKPPDHPTPQQAWDVRAPTVPLRVGWLQPGDISPAAVFLASH